MGGGAHIFFHAAFFAGHIAGLAQGGEGVESTYLRASDSLAASDLRLHGMTR